MIRRAEPGELVYVASTWLGQLVRGMNRSDSWRERARETITRLLVSAPVLVETQLRDGREQVRGWVCFSPMGPSSVLHFVYVRNECREEGIARALVWAAGVDRSRVVLHTHENALARAVIKRTGVRARKIEVT